MAIGGECEDETVYFCCGDAEREAFLSILDGRVSQVHEAGGDVAVEVDVWFVVFGELLDGTDHG